jgi:hypothetical protein
MVYTKFGLFYSNANVSAKDGMCTLIALVFAHLPGYNIFSLAHITKGQDIPKLLNTGAIMHAQIGMFITWIVLILI